MASRVSKADYRIGIMLNLHECCSAVVERKSMDRIDLQCMIERVDGLFITMELRERDTLVIKSIDIIGIDIQGIAECIDRVFKPLKLEERYSLVIE